MRTRLVFLSAPSLLFLATLLNGPAAEPRRPVFNQAPLASVPFANLPLGSIKAKGWLLNQLENQRDGLTGHAETVIPELGPESGWRGGKGEGWEKGPYYLKGLVPLAYTLDDPALKQRAQVWIEAILASQQPDGFYGPGQRDKVDWWPRMVVDWALRDYFEATGDVRVPKHLAAYYRYMAANLPKRPLFEWGKARAADEMETVFWLYNQTGDKSLLDVAALLRKQAWDWVDIYTRNRFQHHGTFMTYHNVNVPQAFKFPLTAFQLSGSAADRDALKTGWQHLERDHGLSFGMTAGTEFLSGNSPSQGTEMCSFVEQMLSFYATTRVLGDPSWADRAEKIAFNGMPAGLTKDFKQYQYYTCPNEVIAIPGAQHFNQEYTDGLIPGPHSGCHCCCYNLHMGWPKFAQHAWMASADGGLAAVLYAPNEVKARVAGADVTITEDGAYPFEEKLALTLKTARPVEFPLHLRIPDWCAAPVVKINGQTQSGVKPGSFFVVKRAWSNGDKVTLEFPMTITAKPGVLNTVSVERGPLVYALKIGEKFTPLNSEPHGFPDLQCEPATPWNYALVFDPAAPAASFAFAQDAVPANPFVLSSVPVRITAKARRLPSWTLAHSGRVAFDPPVSPVASSEPEETITLAPVGATKLRVTSFPWIGTPVPPPASFQADFNDGTLTGWVLYGGNCSVQDGQLVLGPDNHFMHAIVPGLSFADVTVEADVAVGDKGNGGLVLRADKVATGPDAYQGYFVGIDAGRKQIVAGKANGKSFRSLATAPLTVEAAKPLRLKVTAKGSHFSVFAGTDPKPVCEFTDSDYPRGAIGVREYGAKLFTVDNVAARP